MSSSYFLCCAFVTLPIVVEAIRAYSCPQTANCMEKHRMSGSSNLALQGRWGENKNSNKWAKYGGHTRCELTSCVSLKILIWAAYAFGCLPWLVGDGGHSRFCYEMLCMAFALPPMCAPREAQGLPRTYFLDPGKM
ncbi:hypothetical protein V8C43DRAFT_295836 [Trichoderma afarasin]